MLRRAHWVINIQLQQRPRPRSKPWETSMLAHCGTGASRRGVAEAAAVEMVCDTCTLYSYFSIIRGQL